MPASINVGIISVTATFSSCLSRVSHPDRRAIGTVDGIHRCLENGFINEAAFLIDFEEHYPATDGDRAEWENTTLISLPDSERGFIWVFDSDERFWDRLGAYRRQQEGRELREVADAVMAQADGHQERRVRARL